MARESTAVYLIYVLAAGGTTAALVMGMGKDPDGTAARGAAAGDYVAQAGAAPPEATAPVESPPDAAGTAGETGEPAGETGEPAGEEEAAPSPEPELEPEPEPEAAPPQAEDDGEPAAPAEEEPSGRITSRLARAPTFVKGSGVAWGDVEAAVSGSARRANGIYARCLNKQGVAFDTLPETGVADLKFAAASGGEDAEEGGGGGGADGPKKPSRVQVFGDSFVANEQAHKCLKRGLKSTTWDVPGGASVRFRLTFEYE